MADPIRIGKLLASFPGMAERLAEARLVAAWPDVAGPAAARSHAEGVDNGVLHVAVDSSGWLHRLTLEEPQILARCRAIADVHAIRFHLAPPEAGPSAQSSGRRGSAPAAGLQASTEGEMSS